MNGPSGERITEWAGGTLSELMSVLSAAALPARIQVFAPGPGAAPAGEVHLLAGGVSDAFAGAERGPEAVSALQRVASARFAIDTRLPDPETGSLAKPGPAEGNLAQRPLVEIMRYCEQYVLTCAIEVWRGEEEARISYRRGELVGTTVGGSDTPERLPEVMGWKEGFFEIVLPPPVTPPVPAISKRSSASMAVVGAGAPARPAQPPAGARVRRKTNPFITVDAVKTNTPARAAGALQSTGQGGPKVRPGSPLPGLQPRVAEAAPARPAQATEPRPAPSAPASAFPLLSPPISKTAPSSVPPTAPAQARTAQAPVTAATALEVSPARPLSSPAIAAQAGGTTRPAGPAAPAPIGTEVTPAPPAAVAKQPLARIPARVTQAPLVAPPVATPVARDARAAGASSQAALPSLAARTSGAQIPARPMSPPAAKAPAAPPTASQGSAGNPPQASAPDSLAAGAPAAPVRRTAPALATPPSTQAASAAVGKRPEATSRPRPSKPAESPAASAIRGESTTAAHMAPSAQNHISGEIRRPATPVHGTEERPFGVELSEDMQDPAAFVDTPPPQQPVIMGSLAQSTPTPVSLRPQSEGQPTQRIKGPASVQPDGLSVDIEGPRVRSGKRRAPRGLADWPLLVHVLLGVVLGAAIVVAYSAYYGLPLP